MEKIIAFSNKTEARDKFTKAIQYSSKLIAWSLLKVDKSYHKRFNDLYLVSRDARKIFRLFKSLHEIKLIRDKIKDLIWKTEKIPVIFEIFSRIGYLIYWIFDNVFVLASVKMLKIEDLDSFSYIAHMGWVIGILWGLLKNLYELLSLFINKKNIKSEERRRKIIYELINIAGKLGDLIPASSGVNLPERIVGYQFNDGIIGVGGLISSVVAMWGLWNHA